MKTVFTTNMLLLLFIIPNFGWAQYITVSGYVSNGVNGKALENVSIFERNSEIGTITNQNGFYKLVLEKGAYSIKVSDNDFKPYSQDFTIDSDTTLFVKLQPKLQTKNKPKKNAEYHADVKTDKKVNNRSWKIF